MNFRFPQFPTRRRSPMRRAATWSLIPLGLSAGWLGASVLHAPHDMSSMSRSMPR